MNLSQLRKQAKNLKQIHPEPVAARGSAMSLTQAQEAIARIQGASIWVGRLCQDRSRRGLPLRRGGRPRYRRPYPCWRHY